MLDFKNFAQGSVAWLSKEPKSLPIASSVSYYSLYLVSVVGSLDKEEYMYIESLIITSCSKNSIFKEPPIPLYSASADEMYSALASHSAEASNSDNNNLSGSLSPSSFRGHASKRDKWDRTVLCHTCVGNRCREMILTNRCVSFNIFPNLFSFLQNIQP